jgi:hypothetical protein
MLPVTRKTSQAGPEDAQVDHHQSLDEKNDTCPGQAADDEEYSGNNQKFRQARHKKHRFAFAFFQDPVRLPGQD